LERKQKKGDKDFHVVAANETLHDICQKEGVRIDCIMQYNNIKKNTEPVTGEKIYLKATAPVNPKTVLVSVDNSSLKNSL
jgi:LysM repeat protein